MQFGGRFVPLLTKRDGRGLTNPFSSLEMYAVWWGKIVSTVLLRLIKFVRIKALGQSQASLATSFISSMQVQRINMCPHCVQGKGRKTRYIFFFLFFLFYPYSLFSTCDKREWLILCYFFFFVFYSLTYRERYVLIILKYCATDSVSAVNILRRKYI